MAAPKALDKIVHLTTVHDRRDTRIFRKECRSLAVAGYQVVLIAPGDSNDVVREDPMEGVRCRLIGVARGRLSRMTRLVWRAYRAARCEQANLYQFHDPELLPVGLLLKLEGRTVVYDAHESVPDGVHSKTYIPRLLQWPLAAVLNVIEKATASLFDAVVAATPAIAGRFSRRKTVLVQNYPVVGELHDDHSAADYLDREPLFGYVGAISALRGIREVVDAVGAVASACDARLLLAGRFASPALQVDLSATDGWRRVEFMGWQDREGVRSLLSRVRAGLVTFHPAPNHIRAQPNKLFEYMSAGIPVIASDFPLWREIVESTGCGLLVDPRDAAAVARAMTWILQNPVEAREMGRRGREAVRTRFNWATQSRALLDLYQRILPPGSPGLASSKPVNNTARQRAG